LDQTQVVTNFVQWKDGKTITERKDIAQVLSAIFSKRTLHLEEFDERSKSAIDQKLMRENNIIDKIQSIWGTIFPHRNLSFKDWKVFASINSKEYNGVEMSDGERVVLYLISQVLLVPANKTIIIDEPEIHLHRSIMNRLWTELEKERPDCLFIYITHDTQFAANHKQAKKIWVKSFNGKNWDWEEIKDNESGLPEQLLLDILGNRKKVLFVEGDANSFDTRLFREIYKEYYVIPCGSCAVVIAQTKAMKKTPQLHHLKCFGLIDRDCKNQTVIDEYKNDDVYTINVAEIENIFLVEELQNIVCSILKQDVSKIEDAKKYVIETKFSNQIDRQIKNSTQSELYYQLSKASGDIIGDISEDKITEAKEKITSLPTKIDYDRICNEQKQKYTEICDNGDYKKVLLVCNEKGVFQGFGKFFGLLDEQYRNLIIKYLQGKDSYSQRIIDAIKLYLPKEIPIE